MNRFKYLLLPPLLAALSAVLDTATAKSAGMPPVAVTADSHQQTAAEANTPVPHYWLKACQKNGMTAAFSFSEHPEVTMDGATIVVTSGTTVVEYPGREFSHFTLIDEAKTPDDVAIRLPQGSGTVPSLSGRCSGWLVLTGCSPNVEVTVHNLSGHQVAKATTDAQGRAELQLSKLGKGIFIIKTQETTFKITQR